MTRFSDNIYSGFEGVTSALSSQSPVVLRRVHTFTNVGAATGSTQLGVFPPRTENVNAQVFIVVNGSATVSDKVTVSAGGLDMVTFSSFGSAQGILDRTTTSLGTVTTNASAMAGPVPPAVNQAQNGPEVPYAVTFLPSSASRNTVYKVVLEFNRMDRNFQA